MTEPYDATGAIHDGRLRAAQLKMCAMLQVVDHICKKHALDYWLDAGTLLGAVRHAGFIPWDDDLDIAMTRNSFEAFLRVAPLELPEDMWLQTTDSDPGFFNMATPLKIRDKKSYYLEKHETGDEPYVQGIFIDVFVYDYLPKNAYQRRLYKFIAKKISRILSTQKSVKSVGHYRRFYQIIGRLLPSKWLMRWLNTLIQYSNLTHHDYLGRGYQCVGRNQIHKDNLFPLQRIQFEGALFNIPREPHTILSQQYGDYWQIPVQDAQTLRHCKALYIHQEE